MKKFWRHFVYMGFGLALIFVVGVAIANLLILIPWIWEWYQDHYEIRIMINRTIVLLVLLPVGWLFGWMILGRKAR